MTTRHEMTIALTPSEMARSWLVEHYRRQGSPPMRTMIALGVMVIGGVGVARNGAPVAWLALVWGAFLTLRPILFAASLFFTRRQSKPFVVTVDARGVNIAGDKGARLIPWPEITASGLGTDYLWYEVRRGSRATIPFRVMTDRAELEALFRQHVATRG